MKTAYTLIEKGTLMTKPRHHTLQGICQDVCVNYQQVVEVHRRIRDVVLTENGKVITHNLGTFFCRDVRPRVGVLNGMPWSTEGFFEVGLSGERTERGGSHSDARAERVSFVVTSGQLSFESVLADLFGPFPTVEWDFTQGLPVLGRNGRGSNEQFVVDLGEFDSSTVSASGLNNGFHDVTFEVAERDNIDGFRFESLVEAEALLVVNGDRIGMSQSTTVGVFSPVTVEIDDAILNHPRRPNLFNYRVSYTYVNGADE